MRFKLQQGAGSHTRSESTGKPCPTCKGTGETILVPQQMGACQACKASGSEAVSKTYHAGDVIESDEDLEARYPGKFVNVDKLPGPSQDPAVLNARIRQLEAELRAATSRT